MIDWNRPIQTRDGHRIDLRGRDGWQEATGDTRHRGFVQRDSKRDGTVYLYRDDGRCRGDGAESPNDAVQAA